MSEITTTATPKTENKAEVKTEAKKTAVKKTAVKKPTTPTTSKTGAPDPTVKKTNQCLCGCGTVTGSKFAPGHDARLKGVMMREVANGGLSAKHSKLVADLGWEKIIDAKAIANLAAAAKKAGVTVPQLHILRVLSKAQNGLTRVQIGEKVKVTMGITDHLGPIFTDDNAAVEKRNGYPTLVGLKMVSSKMHDENGKDVIRFFLAAAGKRAIEKAAK